MREKSRQERADNRTRFTRPPESADYNPHVERQKTQLGFTLKRVLHVDVLDRSVRKECWHFFTITPEHNHQQWDGQHYSSFDKAMAPLKRFAERIVISLETK